MVRAKDRRAADRQKRRGKAGGDPDFERSIPNDNQRQNRQFADATKGLTPEEADRLHREVSGQGFDYAEIRRLAEEIVLERKQ